MKVVKRTKPKDHYLSHCPSCSSILLYNQNEVVGHLFGGDVTCPNCGRIFSVWNSYAGTIVCDEDGNV